MMFSYVILKLGAGVEYLDVVIFIAPPLIGMNQTFVLEPIVFGLESWIWFETTFKKADEGMKVIYDMLSLRISDRSRNSETVSQTSRVKGAA